MPISAHLRPQNSHSSRTGRGSSRVVSHRISLAHVTWGLLVIRRVVTCEAIKPCPFVL